MASVLHELLMWSSDLISCQNLKENKKNPILFSGYGEQDSLHTEWNLLWQNQGHRQQPKVTTRVICSFFYFKMIQIKVKLIFRILWFGWWSWNKSAQPDRFPLLVFPSVSEQRISRQHCNYSGLVEHRYASHRFTEGIQDMKRNVQLAKGKLVLVNKTWSGTLVKYIMYQMFEYLIEVKCI